MARFSNFLVGITLTTTLAAQVRPAYNVFDAKGKNIPHQEFLRTVSGADVILFGEEHDDPIAHWLQLLVAQHLASQGVFKMGAEMLEADDQNTLDRYLNGEIDQAAFDTLARLWKNHARDYAPLVELAKAERIPFIATNVPRRYARAVSKGGFAALDTLTRYDPAWVAPLPIAFDPQLPGYVKMLTLMGDHARPEMAMAQALKDATMAHFIAKHAHKGTRFLHFNGSFHSDFHEGIGWYLARSRPELSIVTIATVTQGSVNELGSEHLGQADIIICVDEAIPGTH